MIYAPNILITNYCNQNCAFCFARKEMAPDAKKEMSLDEIAKLFRKMKRSGRFTTVKLLGGEPTIHSRFAEIVDLSLRYFRYIQLFTNGLFSDKIVRHLNGYGRRIKYTFNLMTPGYLLNKKVRELVLRRIQEASPASEMTAAYTIDPYTNLTLLFKTMPRNFAVRFASVRIGLSNPVVGEKNSYDFAQFPHIGTVLTDMVRLLRKVGFRKKITINCGLTRCMFTDMQFDYLIKNTTIPGFGCFGKQSSMDVGTDMKAFHCFPLSKQKRIPLRGKGFEQTSGKLILDRLVLWRKTEKRICVTCPFYGTEQGKCPGPCIAFRVNERLA